MSSLRTISPLSALILMYIESREVIEVCEVLFCLQGPLPIVSNPADSTIWNAIEHSGGVREIISGTLTVRTEYNP
ncbi:hypothetical protein OH77DRAFT_829602 [Trametes cingulata]|nr:hypothetical protein OH77DRAFT_829602 [Trametes cingulata]